MKNLVLNKLLPFAETDLGKASKREEAGGPGVTP